MLRKVKIKNFIHFADEHTLHFEEGSNFFIGENHTGKTSLFEAIRRCMSVSKSKGLSGAHDPDKLAYVTCVFATNDGNTVKSSMIRFPGTDLRDEDQIFLKVVQSSCNNTIYADLVKKNSKGKLVCQQIPDTILQGVRPLMTAEAIDFHAEVTSKLQESRALSLMRKKVVDNYAETDSEQLLKRTVDEYTIILFSFRSISPFESTVSEWEPKERRQQIARQVSGRADILKWYLQSNKDIDASEGIEKNQQRKNEEKIFNMITDNSGFQFNIDDKEVISVTNSKMRKRKLDSASLLLKIPEGIYEAKILAILLTVQKFTTVCLDDAERGMHPQMIERIRDHVLLEVKDKIILLITHHPSYLTRWNIPRLFLFQRAVDEDNDSFKIRPMSIILSRGAEVQGSSTTTHVENMDEKTLQLIGEHNVASLFFARRILLVEGKSDELFITAFVYVLTHDHTILSAYLPEESPKTIEELRHFLYGLHIVPMYGAANVYKFHSLCQNICLDHYMILDYDVMFDNVGNTRQGSTEEEEFCKKLNLSITADECKQLVLENVAILETHNIFMWTPIIRSAKSGKRKVKSGKNKEKSGTIEVAVQTVFDKNPAEKECLNRCLISRRNKLLLDKNVDYECIQALAKKCAKLSKQDTSLDLNRLVRFFLKKSNGE